MTWLDSLGAKVTTAIGDRSEKQPGLATDGAIADIVTKLGDGNRLMGQLVKAILDLSPRSTNSFTMDAAASKTITDGNVETSSFVVLTPMNAAAATLMGSSASLYWVAATGEFTVSTASGASAAGTETFSYAVFTSTG